MHTETTTTTSTAHTNDDGTVSVSEERVVSTMLAMRGAGESGPPRMQHVRVRRERKHSAVVAHRDDIPEFLQCPGIVGYYRCFREYSDSYRRVLRSLFELHNETVNVWTHLLAAAVYLFVAAPYVFLWRLRGAPPLDRWILSGYFVAAAACFLLSAAYHLLLVHSLMLFRLMRLADYQGILVLVSASYIAAISVGYRCHWRLALRYLRLNALFYALAVLVLCYSHRKDLHRSRNMAFVTYVMWGVWPLAAGYVMQVPHVDALTRDALTMWSVYGVGFALYATHFPERFVWRGRGRWDLFGHSHQWFHVATIAASAMWGRSIIRLHEHMEASGAC